MMPAAPANVATNAPARPYRRRARPRPRAIAPGHRGVATNVAPTPTKAPAMNQKIAMRPPEGSSSHEREAARVDVTIHMIRAPVTMSQAADILSPTTDKKTGENRQLHAFRLAARVRSHARRCK